MQHEFSAVSGVRPARSLAVALLLGSAAVVGLVCLTKGESFAVPSAPGALVLPVFPLLEEADALQASDQCEAGRPVEASGRRARMVRSISLLGNLRFRFRALIFEHR